METKISLRDHQVPMAERTDELYESGKNFAGVVLATGGGKSFIAMDQIIKFANSYNERNPIAPEEQNRIPKVFSNVPCYYFSPTNIILYQFKLHMAQNIMAPEYVLDYERAQGPIQGGNEIEAAKTILSQMNPRIKVDDINFDELLAEVKTDGAETKDVVKDLVKVALEQIPSTQVERLVETAFPNINFTTYQALEQTSEKDINKMQAEFVIFDEAHRAGAEKWWPKVQSMIGKTGAKVLAITATPERDVDEKDMMRDLALLPNSGYSVREVRKKEYYAGNMPLLKAIEGGHLTPPNVVHFNCKLDETPEFEAALKAYMKAFVKAETAKSSSRQNAMNAFYNVESAFEKMLILVRRDPLIDLDPNLSPAEKEARKKADEEAVKNQVKQIKSDLTSKIREGVKGKLSEEEILKSCMGIVRSDEWEVLKKERVSTIISQEVKARGIEEGKAINFIEAMEGKSTKGKEDKEEKTARAKEHIAKKIEELKELFDEKIMKMPEITAVHSAAFTIAENNEILNKFMKKASEGRMKIIAAVSKFNEGFHPDGIRALFMTKPIDQNAKKESEPRIILLQQIGRCLSAGQKEPSVIFDIACNFMRNHEKFKAEAGKDCFAFLRLSPEEKEFLNLSRQITNDRRKASEIRPDSSKLMTILDVLNKKGIKVNSETIKENMNLESFVQSIEDPNLREEVLDELFLKEIELDTDGSFEMGAAYRYARGVYLGDIQDPTELKKLAQIPLPEMLRLGVIETQTKEGLKSLNGKVNRAGFVVRGVVDHTFAYNVYTGTKFDGPETDPERKDYFGCGPDGRDPAGFDRFGFDKDGIHRVTGRNHDERHFSPVKETDASGKEVVTWYYVNPKTGEKSETDPLGFNYEGINPKTGFDRDGYWHRRKEDGTFSISRSKLNDDKEDVHHFVFRSVTEKLGLYHGAKMRFKNERGLHSNGSIFQAGIGKDADRYGYDGFDIDGFNPNGFNADGIHRDTSTEYGLDGKDKSGRLQLDLQITREIMSLLKSGKVKAAELPRRLGKSPEEVDRVIGNAYSISRTIDGIAKLKSKDPNAGKDVIGLISMTKENPKTVDELFKLSPSMRKQAERALLDNRRMNKYYSDRVGTIMAAMQKQQNVMKAGEQAELTELAQKLDANVGSVEYRRPEDDDFVL